MSKIGITTKNDGLKATTYTRGFIDELKHVVNNIEHAWHDGFVKEYQAHIRTCRIPECAINEKNAYVLRTINWLDNEYSLNFKIEMARRAGKMYAQTLVNDTEFRIKIMQNTLNSDIDDLTNYRKDGE